MKRINLFLTLALATTIGSMNADIVTDQIQQIKQQFLDNKKFKAQIEAIEKIYPGICSERTAICMTGFAESKARYTQKNYII